MSLGAMKRCCQLMLRFAERRTVATGRLLDNPVTRYRLDTMTKAIRAVEALVYTITRRLDEGGAVPLEAYFACKASAPELLWNAVDNLIQLLGGRGYVDTNIAPRLMRDARLLRIFEGPTETMIAFLGSRVLTEGDSVYHFLSGDLG